jgi:hypothetical protein
MKEDMIDGYWMFICDDKKYAWIFCVWVKNSCVCWVRSLWNLSDTKIRTSTIHMQLSIPESNLLSFHIVVIGHCERTFTSDCEIASFVLLVNEMNASCSRCSVGRNSSVGMVTRCRLDCPGIELGGRKIYRTRLDRPWTPPIFQYYRYRVYFTTPHLAGITEIHLSSFWALMPCTLDALYPYPYLHRWLGVR